MNRNIIPASLLFSLFGLLATPVYAQWEIYKFLDVGVLGTDNLRQLDSGGEVVFSVRPSVELEFDGNRFDTDIVVGLEALRFVNEEDNILDPQFTLTTQGPLIENALFLNSSVEIGKVVSGADVFDLTDDSDTQLRFRLNPFVARQFGQTTDFFLGYGHQSLDNDIDGSIDFIENTLQFALNRDPSTGGLIWGVGANYENQAVDGDGFEQNFDSNSVFASLGYTVRQGTLVEVVFGREDNDITNLNAAEDSGGFVEGRVRWTPNERTSLVVGYSDRFFGEGLILSFSHRVRNSELTASATREVGNQDLTLGEITPFAGDVDSPVPTDGGLLDGDITGRSLFVDERYSVGYKLAGRRSDFIVDAIFSDQEEIDGSETRTQFIGRAAFDRQLSSLTTVRFQYQFLAEEDEDGSTENENRFGIRLIYNFDRKERESILSSVLSKDDELQ